jgi:zinc protease
MIDSLQNAGPSQAAVDKVKEEMVRAHELELKQNNWWLSTIEARDQDGEDIAAALVHYDAMVRSLTTEQIRQAARQYFNVKNYVHVVLMPER